MGYEFVVTCPSFSSSSDLRAVKIIVNDLVSTINDDAEGIFVRLAGVQVVREVQTLHDAPSTGGERYPIVCRVVRKISGLHLR